MICSSVKRLSRIVDLLATTRWREFRGAGHRANDWIERDGPDGKKVRVFDNENFRLSERQIAALQWRISKLKPKRYYW
jgi:hypothetical protein